MGEVIFDDGEFSVVAWSTDGNGFRQVESYVFKEKTGAWSLSASAVEKIRTAKTSDEVVAIIDAD